MAGHYLCIAEGIGFIGINKVTSRVLATTTAGSFRSVAPQTQFALWGASRLTETLSGHFLFSTTWTLHLRVLAGTGVGERAHRFLFGLNGCSSSCSFNCVILFLIVKIYN